MLNIERTLKKVCHNFLCSLLVWRYCRPIGFSAAASDEQQTPSTPSIQVNPLTRLQKLELSLKHRVPTTLNEKDTANLIEQIVTNLQTKWNLLKNDTNHPETKLTNGAK